MSRRKIFIAGHKGMVGSGVRLKYIIEEDILG